MAGRCRPSRRKKHLVGARPPAAAFWLGLPHWMMQAAPPFGGATSTEQRENVKEILGSRVTHLAQRTDRHTHD